MSMKVRVLPLLGAALATMAFAGSTGTAYANSSSTLAHPSSSITVDDDFQACFEVDMGNMPFSALLTAHGETTTTRSSTVISYQKTIVGFGSIDICAVGGDPKHEINSLVATVTAVGAHGGTTNTSVVCRRIEPGPMTCTEVGDAKIQSPWLIDSPTPTT